jgi:mercuric ion transport protein
MNIKRHFDKIGTAGSVFAALCCLGTPALLAFLSSIGLAFIIRDAVLLPLLALFLILTGYGLWESKKVHGRKEPITVFGVSAVVITVSMFISSIGVVLGMVGLVGSTIMNAVYRKSCASGCEVSNV